MNFIDTHTHLYLEAFDDDREGMLTRARANGIHRFYLPDIDSSTRSSMIKMGEDHPDECFPMAGLHPTSVKDNYLEELEEARKILSDIRIRGIGECGLDMYWDKSRIEEQKHVFESQLKWSLENGLPVSIHIRDAFSEIFEVLSKFGKTRFKGVFHCFTGGEEEAEIAFGYGFLLGIGGIITFKNSPLQKLIKNVDPERVVLESDAPFLAPAPFRGKRNEPAYLVHVAEKLAEIWCIPIKEVADITTANALRIF